MTDWMLETRRGPKHLVFQRYEEEMNRQGQKASSIESYHKSVRRFEEWLDLMGLTLEEVECEQVEDYFYRLPLARTTKELHLSHLRAAIRRAHRRGHLSTDPTDGVKLPRKKDKPIRALSSEQLRRLLGAAQTEQEQRMVMVAIYTGMRRFEIAKLNWDDISLPNGTIQVIGKFDKIRLVPLHPALQDVLAEEQFPHGPLFPSRKGSIKPEGLDGKLRRLRDRTDILLPYYHDDGTMEMTPPSFHDFRRTVASSLSANGVPEYLIERIMGWSKNSVFDKHYRSVAGKLLHEAILRLYADDPVRSENDA